MRVRATALFLTSLLVAAVLAVSPAGAAAPAQVWSSTFSEGERDAARAYWTPARRAAARPGEVRLAERGRGAGSPGRVERGTPFTVAPLAKPGNGNGKGGGGGDGTTTVTGATWTRGGLVASTTGKVFFTLSGTNYVCSGSVVNSQNQSLVLTAGHCLHEGPGHFASNFVFVPAYSGDGRTQQGPYGTWAAQRLSTTSQWAQSGDFNYDVGFAVVEKRGTATLAGTVGAQGIGFNQARGAHVYAFGYPAASPYTGATLTYCAGGTVNDPYGYSTQGVVCDMTGGSSGGPWYSAFADTSGTGTAYSVNSYRYTRGPHTNKMFGPYFGSAIQSLYTSAAAS